MLREYEAKKDRDDVRRLWREVGWVKDGEEQLLAMDRFVASGHGFVAQANGQAECFVGTAPGTIRHLADDLPLCAVTSVATGRVARKQGLASALAAKAVARGAADGALVSALGVFDQGFYDQLGFGSGKVERSVFLDPASLVVDVTAQTARRLGQDTWKEAHASRLARMRSHGSVNITPPEITGAEMVWSKNGFGLGYHDATTGQLTHCLWAQAFDVEHGPYNVQWLSYRTPAQFLELMGLLRSLGDQISLIRLHEPPGIQLQDLVNKPLRHWRSNWRYGREAPGDPIYCWQARIMDLPGCLERTHLRGDEVRFNLALSDPIGAFLSQDEAWTGVTGEYVVTLGPSSGAERGADPALPTLSASVNAFSRLWLGVGPATGLAVTADLSGPAALLEQLDWALRLPEPKPDWDF